MKEKISTKKLEESNEKFFKRIAKIYDKGFFKKILNYRVKKTTRAIKG